jgi:hypothetical protein
MCCTPGGTSSAASSPARCCAPRFPFRRFLAREQHRVEACTKVELTPAVIMRRMTKVSPYPYWHFFDAYPPGYLRAVYRGNGIPLPWGNMAQVTDPCPHWAVFRMLDETSEMRASQISVLRDGAQSLLYCCHSHRTLDMSGNPRTCSRSAWTSCRRCARTPRRLPDRREHHRECLQGHHGEAEIPTAAATRRSVKWHAC